MTTSSIVANRYKLTEKLGQGGMGVVYKAYDRLNRQAVALKQMLIAPSELDFASKQATTDDSLSLALEFRVLASLRHPHIVSVLDYGFDRQGQAFYTMQLLESPQTLTEAAMGGKLAEKVRLINEALLALVYLHRRKVIHRDLKPANIGVTSSGHVKVLDFGLALYQHQLETSNSGVSGTLAYMAPELFQGRPASIQSDLYAMGVIIYEVLVGQHPFNTDTATGLIMDILTKTPDTNMLSDDLADVVQRLLEKSPEKRYQNASDIIDDLCTATDQPLPIENDMLRESFLQASAFVGREAELNLLNEALENTAREQGAAWLVGGESGVGKSRLLEEIRTRALIRGMIVLRGQAVSNGGMLNQMWRDILRRLILYTPLSDLEASVIKDLLPDIEMILERTVPDAASLDAAAMTRRLSLTIMDILMRQTQPILLILEDLQWAGDGLAPLVQLSPIAKNYPWLIIGSYRDDEAPDLPKRFPDMSHLPLSRLSDNAVANLASAILGEAGEQANLIDLLQKETEGNAFFMVEVVRALAEDSGGLAEIGRKTLQRHIFVGGIQGVLRRRLERVPLWAQKALKFAAILGRQPDRSILSAVLPDLNWEDWVTLCVNASVLEVVEETWRFAHDKLREAVLSDLQDAERRDLYQKAAEITEALYGDNVQYAEILADTWRSAGNDAKSVDFTHKAAAYLINFKADFTRAEQMIMQVLPLTEQPDLVSHHADLLAWLAEALRRLGRHDEAKAYASDILAMQNSELPSRTRALTILGLISMVEGRYEEARQYANQALAQITGNSEQRMNNVGILAASAFYQGYYADADTSYTEMLEFYQANNDKRGIASALHNKGNVAGIQGHHAAARALYEQSLAMRREIGDRSGTAVCLTGLGTVLKQIHDYAGSEVYYRESLSLSRQIQEPTAIVNALSNLAFLKIEQTNYRDAQAYIQEALLITRKVGMRYNEASALEHLGLTEDLLGHYPLSRDLHEQALHIRHETGDRRGIGVSLQNLGSVAYWQQDYATAQNYFEQTLVLMREMNNQQGLAYALMTQSALYITQNDVPQAQTTLSQSITLAVKIKDPHLVLDVAMQQARLFALQGELMKAAELAVLVEAMPYNRPYAKTRWLPPLLLELKAAVDAEVFELIRADSVGKDITAILITGMKDIMGD